MELFMIIDMNHKFLIVKKTSEKTELFNFKKREFQPWEKGKILPKECKEDSFYYCRDVLSELNGVFFKLEDLSSEWENGIEFTTL